MFVKKIPRWKIKRFIKGVIRSILFFVIISSFVFTCSANPSYRYDDFDTFVDNGFIQFHLRNSNSQIVRSSEFGSSSNLNYMNFTVDNSSAFNSVFMSIQDSNNVQQSFKSRDSVVLVHDIVVQLSGSQPSADYAKKFTVDINYTDNDTFVNGELSFRFEDALKSYDYINTSWGSIVRYSVDINAVMPNINGTITSIDYHFYDIVADGYKFIISPSAEYDGSYINDLSLIYYVGNSQNAPIYTIPDDTPLKDFEDAENNLIDSATQGFDDWGSFLLNLPTHISNVFNWVRGASDIFMLFYNSLDWRFQSVIMVLLCIGTFSFVVGITNTILTKNER